ncbi:MAG TPA: hypothetical protein DCM38_12775, partial [Gammaproteobacteria bacterium]|nr:hypothetical protein [Gammaproteobacteria bacterium]
LRCRLDRAIFDTLSQFIPIGTFPLFWLPLLGIATDPIITWVSGKLWIDNLFLFIYYRYRQTRRYAHTKIVNLWAVGAARSCSPRFNEGGIEGNGGL